MIEAANDNHTAAVAAAIRKAQARPEAMTTPDERELIIQELNLSPARLDVIAGGMAVPVRKLKFGIAWARYIEELCRIEILQYSPCTTIERAHFAVVIKKQWHLYWSLHHPERAAREKYQRLYRLADTQLYT
jgi:hypothetical protein